MPDTTYFAIGFIILIKLLDIYLITRHLVAYSRTFLPFFMILKEAPRFGVQSNTSSNVLAVPVLSGRGHMVVNGHIFRSFLQVAVCVPNSPNRRYWFCMSPCSAVLVVGLVGWEFVGSPQSAAVAFGGLALLAGFYAFMALRAAKRHTFKKAPAGIY